MSVVLGTKADHRLNESWNMISTSTKLKELQAIQRQLANVACDLELWPIKNSFCVFLARVKNYTHTKKLNMYIYWFSSESGNRRQQQRRQRRTPQYNH